ncbi:MAG TPA: FtsX-like permease family protein [Microthrixaceae bacterium]|nr:FtsX-like permease family protein [Microthrixaceae bacterium]
MDRFRLLARATLRRRWRSLIAAGLLAGFVGGGLLVAVTVARRTSTAFDRLVEATRLEDVRVFSFFGRADAEAVTELPQVEESWIGTAIVSRLRGDQLQYVSMLAGPERPADLYRPRLLEGRRADPDAFDEVVADAALVEHAGLEVGDVITLDLLTYDDFLAFDEGFGEPHGPTVELEVVGVTTGPAGGGSTSMLETTPAFAQRYAPLVVGRDGGATHDVIVRLEDRDDLAEFSAGVEGITRAGVPEGGSELQRFQVRDPHEAAAPVDAAARVVVLGLMVGLGIAALAGGTAVVQFLIRRHALDEPSRGIESALGMTFRDQAVARALTGGPTAAIAATTAVLFGVAASGIGPPGSLTMIEPDPGMSPNWVVLGLGAVAVLVLTTALDLLAFVTVARARVRRRAFTRRSAVAVLAGGSVPAIDVGVDLAFDRRGGRAAIAARSARVGAIIGVAGVMACLVYAASLDRLAATPSRWGWQADATVLDVDEETVDVLLGDERVEALSQVQSNIAVVEGEGAGVYAFDMRRGSVGWTVLDGRLPTSPDEVLLGARIARREGVEVGDRVHVEGETGGERDLTVVGVGVGPRSGEEFGNAIVITPPAFDSLFEGSYREAYLDVEDGELDEFLADHADELEMEVPTRPAEIENLASLSAFPYVLGGFLAIIGLAALANAVVVIGGQRRRDLGTLRALGMTRWGVRLSFCVAGLAMAALGIVIGAPLGVVVGSMVWRAVAMSAYVDGESLFSLWLVVVPVAVLVVSAVISLAAGARASRGAPGPALRSE